MKALFFWVHVLLCSSSSSLAAVSRTQMRTLRCGLRYTGLARRPRSVHRCRTKRCTEPLRAPPTRHCHPSPIVTSASLAYCFYVTRWLAPPRPDSPAHSCPLSLHHLLNTPVNLISQGPLCVNSVSLSAYGSTKSLIFHLIKSC